MHRFLEQFGNRLGWAMIGGGSFITWLSDHGATLFGIIVGVGGLWIQWKTYRLRERVAERQGEKGP